jgi:hypothetical protein
MDKKKQIKAKKSTNAMSLFMVTGYGVLIVFFLLYYKYPKILPVLSCAFIIYLVVSTVLALRAVRALRDV